MKLKILSSDSSGNCYILESKDEALIIEAGVHLKDVKIALDFDLGKVAGCVVSHLHGDHYKHASSYIDAGIKFHGPGSLPVFQKWNNPLKRVLCDRMSFDCGGFRIQPFEVVHDTETFCFLIKHEEMGLCAFVTDTHYLPYTFRGVNQWIIECNYDQKILDDHVLSGRLLPVVRKRIIESHMSLDTVKDVMRANDLTQVNNIVLIHLSNANSDARRFKREIEDLTGKKVTVADAGVEIDFNKEF